MLDHFMNRKACFFTQVCLIFVWQQTEKYPMHSWCAECSNVVLYSELGMIPDLVPWGTPGSGGNVCGAPLSCLQLSVLRCLKCSISENWSFHEEMRQKLLVGNVLCAKTGNNFFCITSLCLWHCNAPIWTNPLKPRTPEFKNLLIYGIHSATREHLPLFALFWVSKKLHLLHIVYIFSKFSFTLGTNWIVGI